MSGFAKLTVVLAVVSCLAAGALAVTFTTTQTKIAEQEKAVRLKALGDIFLDGFAKTQELDAKTIAVYKQAADEKPAYYAVTGEGIGYNTGVPITLLVGFTNPAGDAEPTIVGWKVVKSEETPGLGEKAKESRAPYTWLDKLTGQAGAPDKDRRTAFQKQFGGLSPSQLKLKKEGGQIDAITAATYSTVGIMKAIKDAAANLKQSRAGQP